MACPLPDLPTKVLELQADEQNERCHTSSPSHSPDTPADHGLLASSKCAPDARKRSLRHARRGRPRRFQLPDDLEAPGSGKHQLLHCFGPSSRCLTACCPSAALHGGCRQGSICQASGLDMPSTCLPLNGALPGSRLVPCGCRPRQSCRWAQEARCQAQVCVQHCRSGRCSQVRYRRHASLMCREGIHQLGILSVVCLDLLVLLGAWFAFMHGVCKQQADRSKQLGSTTAMLIAGANGTGMQR